jgi:hypothetical protein
VTSHESDFANERCDADAEDFQGGRIAQARGGRSSGAQAAGVTSSGGGAVPVKIVDFWIRHRCVAFLRLAGDPSQFFSVSNDGAAHPRGAGGAMTTDVLNQAVTTGIRATHSIGRNYLAASLAHRVCMYARWTLSITVVLCSRYFFHDFGRWCVACGPRTGDTRARLAILPCTASEPARSDRSVRSRTSSWRDNDGRFWPFCGQTNYAGAK